METKKDNFFMYMIVINILANITINWDMSYGDKPKPIWGFNFSAFLIILIFILTMKKIYNKII